MNNKDPRGSDTKLAKRHELQEDFENIKQKMRETRQAFAQTAHDVKDAAGDMWSQSLKDAKSRSDDIQDNVVTFVRANPVKAIGYAALVGFLLAKLLRK